MTVWHSLREGFFMFWETLWALVLGFTLSGAVQSFVSREEMQRALGDHRPRTIVKSSLWGMASSSCSYAASALAKSLFRRGADFTAAMVFMFASTNLVLELGIVLWLLMGWQFALAELVGGVIMIALFVLAAPRAFPAAEVEAARALGDEHVHEHGSTTRGPLRERLRSRSGWSSAASYTVSDLTMLRRELVVGYVVAGFIAVAVPTSVFTHVFVTGHGGWTDIENVLIGPVIACLSFVCSIGNVPLAAALYAGGISFGGTVAFIFADLVALPLLLIYRTFYGRRLATRLFLTFWAVMSAAGLLVDLLFRGVGISFPHHDPDIAPTRFAWDHTTVLNLVALVVAAAVWWAHTHPAGAGDDSPYAIDPVCGMQVEKAHPGAVTVHEGRPVFFCADRCRERFLTDLDPSPPAVTDVSSPSCCTHEEPSRS